MCRYTNTNRPYKLLEIDLMVNWNRYSRENSGVILVTPVQSHSTLKSVFEDIWEAEGTKRNTGYLCELWDSGADSSAPEKTTIMVIYVTSYLNGAATFIIRGANSFQSSRDITHLTNRVSTRAEI
ncbi:uncharacterized protein [Fopius arisanus]|uniref:Uncharacterized protein n=1 Tax=Fopius arisanus TaxID=64838 RepID=A0A9R1ST98_9HYME|nr:PREDICTED: uncharacterized protein LOC105262713 [Fopius arisanus]